MPDTSPDLPPVGELVQITTAAGVKLAAIYERDGGFTLVGPRLPGTGSWFPGSAVTSWCRVLVLPDTDEIESVIAVALALHINPDAVSACCPKAVLSALREAAIR